MVITQQKGVPEGQAQKGLAQTAEARADTKLELQETYEEHHTEVRAGGG